MLRLLLTPLPTLRVDLPHKGGGKDDRAGKDLLA